MAKARHKTETTSSILQSLEHARQKFDETFQRAIQAVQQGNSQVPRHRVKATSARARIAGSTSRSRVAPVQSEIAKLLKKRRKGLTLEGLRNALPNLDEKSLLNATFAMRRKGLVTFNKSEKGRGVYSWEQE